MARLTSGLELFAASACWSSDAGRSSAYASTIQRGCAVRSASRSCSSRPSDCWSSQSSSGLSATRRRSEEHTSELQSRLHLVCRPLPEKKNANSTRANAEYSHGPKGFERFMKYIETGYVTTTADTELTEPRQTRYKGYRALPPRPLTAV